MKKTPFVPALVICTVFALSALTPYVQTPLAAAQAPRADLPDCTESLRVPTVAAGDIPSPLPHARRSPGLRPLSAGGIGVRPLSNESAYELAYNDLYEAMANLREDCTLSNYQLTRDRVKQLFSDVINHSPELFYVDGTLKIKYNSKTDIVSSVTFAYTMKTDEIVSALEFYHAEIDRILSLMPENMSDVDKALWVHDYLCVRYSFNSELPNYDAYSFFVNKQGVCQGYTMAYMALMQECKIATDFAASTEMDHIWNLIQLDGQWYHVDVTWDDPVSQTYESDFIGRAGHDNFLCSDTAMVQTGHYDWTSRYCSSDRFDGIYLKSVRTPPAYLNGTWYCADFMDGSIQSFSFSSMKNQKLFEVEGVWYSWGQELVYNYTNICAYNGKLYYSTQNEIYIYDPVTKQSNLLLQYTGEEGYIYALRLDGTTLRYTVSKAPSGSPVTDFTYDLSAEPPDTEIPPIPPLEYLNLNCGNDAAMALVTHSAGEDGQSLRIVMVGNLAKLAYCADPVFTVTFRRGEDEIFHYTLEGETLLFYQSLSAGNVRFTAAQGYALFGVSVEKIPPDGWTDAVIRLTDRSTDELLCEHPIENAPDLLAPPDESPPESG